MRIALRCVTCICTLVLLAGCVEQPVAPAVSLLHPASRLDVLELPPTVTDDSLRRLFHNGDKKVTSEILTADRQQLEQLIDAALKQALAQATELPLKTATIALLGNNPDMRVGQPISPAALATLKTQYPADAYLRIQVTDYGQTPKSWEGTYIGFEVVTTLAIGAWLYVHSATRVLAAPYLAQESVEEFSEGYAGFWLFNRLSRPVRIDADLVDATTGKVLWHDTETGLADWHWKNVWHMDADMRNQLLAASTAHAMRDLVDELEGRRSPAHLAQQPGASSD